MLYLPHRTIYIYTKDGHKENVAMSDTLTMEEAIFFKDLWTTKERKIEAVTLEFDGRILRKYEF